MQDMTKLIIVALLSLMGQISFAQTFNYGQNPIVKTSEVLSSTKTCDAIAISSQTPTDVIRSSPTLYGNLFILNVSSAANIMCGDSVNVSSQVTTSNLAGIWIGKGTATTPGGSIDLTIKPGQLWYCINDSANQTSRVVVCRSR